MATIRTAEALALLFDEYGWFECGRCVSLSPPPNGPTTPARVELVFRDFGVGGLDAGDSRTYQELRVIATGVVEWSTADANFTFASDHSMEGVEDLVESVEFGFAVDVPSFVRLRAQAFDYERLPAVIETVAPWRSHAAVGITAAGAQLPSPSEWVRALAGEGVDVVWRVLGGPAQSAERVTEDYTGWFLERPSRLSEHDGGVFFSYVGDERDVVVYLERKEADIGVWRAVCVCVGRMFPRGEFSTGNSRLTADQWSTYVATELS